MLIYGLLTRARNDSVHRDAGGGAKVTDKNQKVDSGRKVPESLMLVG